MHLLLSVVAACLLLAIIVHCWILRVCGRSFWVRGQSFVIHDREVTFKDLITFRPLWVWQTTNGFAENAVVDVLSGHSEEGVLIWLHMKARVPRSMSLVCLNASCHAVCLWYRGECNFGVQDHVFFLMVKRACSSKWNAPVGFLSSDSMFHGEAFTTIERCTGLKVQVDDTCSLGEVHMMNENDPCHMYAMQIPSDLLKQESVANGNVELMSFTENEHFAKCDGKMVLLLRACQRANIFS